MLVERAVDVAVKIFVKPQERRLFPNLRLIGAGGEIKRNAFSFERLQKRDAAAHKQRFRIDGAVGKPCLLYTSRCV